MPQRVHIERQEQGEPEPARRLSEGEARRRLLVRSGLAVIGLAVVIWLIGFVAGAVGTGREAGTVYRKLQAAPTRGTSLNAQIRAFGAMLTPRQVRVLVGGRSLKYEGLTTEQRRAFSAIRPLRRARAPKLEPYEVRLDRLKGRQLRLVWSARGSGEPVVAGVAL